MATSIVRYDESSLPPLPEQDPDAATGTHAGEVHAPEGVLVAASPLRGVLFAPTIDRRVKIIKPFRVALEKHEERFVARIDEIGEFGYGSNSGDALYDLGKTISELYMSLRADRERLSRDLRSVLGILEEHIVEQQL